jgi:hypothetical protein
MSKSSKNEKNGNVKKNEGFSQPTKENRGRLDRSFSINNYNKILSDGIFCRKN